MTASTPDDDEIVSIDDFEAALGRLIVTAIESDVDPSGSWVYRTKDEPTDVEVMILELDDRETTD